MAKTQEQHTQNDKFYPAAELAKLLGISQSYFASTVRPRLAPADVRKEGRSVLLRGSAVVSLWVEIQSERTAARLTAGNAGEIDPLMADISGKGSIHLERYRKARATIEELSLAEKKGSLCRREAIHTGLTRLASLLRDANEILDRDHGPEAGDVMRDALDAFVAEVSQWGPASS